MPLIRRALPLLLAAALSASARAGVVAPAGPVFAAPAGAWSGPLATIFTDPSLSALLPPSLGASPSLTPNDLRATAPLIQSLQLALSVTPEAFLAMPAAERKGAIELAAEDAKEAVRAKAYELSETARQLSRPGRPMDREGRVELYAAVSKLMEMREFYGPWLDEGGKAAVEEGYTLASRTAWEVRTFLLQRDAGPAVERTARPEARPARPEPAKPAYVLDPSGTAIKLRADMENNKSGWGQSDLDTLYTGYGFVLRQGGKHRMYYHPVFPELHASVSRQNDLPPGYAHSAMKLLVELERLTAEQTKTAAAPATGPPATLDLAELSILLSQPKERPVRAEPVASTSRSRAPPAVPARVAAKTVPEQSLPDRPAPPRITARLAPAEPKVAEPKPEPPAVEAAPQKPKGLIERLMSSWGRFNNKSN
ncbi:MAG: hypothetical protein NDJ72_02000 [Elusimicrobia bacterium]|nr:hypothetical protein [Elusimicrobiota bacterium]